MHIGIANVVVAQKFIVGGGRWEIRYKVVDSAIYCAGRRLDFRANICWLFGQPQANQGVILEPVCALTADLGLGI